MTVTSDYQNNAWWGWADFGIVMIVFVTVYGTDIALLVWAILRQRVVRRVKGLISWFIRYRGVPIGIVPGYANRGDNPLMQPALEFLDDLQEIPRQVLILVELWRKYKTALRNWKLMAPDKPPPSWELFLQYVQYRQSTGANVSLTQFAEMNASGVIHQQYLQRLQQQQQMLQQQQQQQQMQMQQQSPMPSGGTPFAAAPASGMPAYDPALAAAQVAMEQQQQQRR